MAGPVKVLQAGGWYIHHFTRSAIDKKAGTAYKKWISPEGVAFRTLGTAVAAGFVVDDA